MTECYRLLQTDEFEEWIESETARSRYQIDGRLAKIRLDGHFGNHKSVSKTDRGITKNRVWEIKFNDGRRIYYAFVEELNILLLLGGNKNGQDKDIEKAKALYIKSTTAKIKEKKYE